MYFPQSEKDFLKNKKNHFYVMGIPANNIL